MAKHNNIFCSTLCTKFCTALDAKLNTVHLGEEFGAHCKSGTVKKKLDNYQLGILTKIPSLLKPRIWRFLAKKQLCLCLETKSQRKNLQNDQ